MTSASDPVSELTRPGAAAAATTGRAVLGGGAWSIVGRILPQLYTLVVSVTAARFLTPDEFGRQSYIAFVELALVMLLTGGLSVGLMRFIGETLGRDHAGAVRGLVRWAWGIEGAAAALGAGVLAAAAAIGAEPTAAWALAGVACALAILHTVPSSLLIGAQLWRAATIAGLVNGLLSIGAMVTVLAAGGGITGMFAVEAATSGVILVWTAALARRAVLRLAPRAAPAGDLRGEVARWSLVASIGVVLNFIVWRRSEFFFLERLSSDQQIGVFSIAFSLVVGIVRLPEALADVGSPVIATLFGAGEHARIRSGYGRAVRLALIMALPLTVVGLVFGPLAIRAIWGTAYSDAGPLFLIMLSTFPMLPLFYIARGALIGIGRQKVLIAASALAALVDVVLAAALVPAFDAVGAALANVGAQLAAAIPIIVAARREFGEIDWAPGALLRTALASGIAGLAALGVVHAFLGVAGLLLGLVVGIAVFAILAATVKILPSGDARWLDGALGRVAGGRLGRAALLCARRP